MRRGRAWEVFFAQSHNTKNPKIQWEVELEPQTSPFGYASRMIHVDSQKNSNKIKGIKIHTHIH